MSEHARLSPSSSSGWLKCAGRIALESAFPDSYSVASDRGTAIHLVAKLVLTEPVEWPAAVRAIGTNVPVHSPDELTRVVWFTQEMAEVAQDYVDTIRAISRGNPLLVEHRVDFSEDIGVPESFGTADAIIVLPLDTGGHELFCLDLKTGWVQVDPVENTQAMLYALGALHEFEMSHDIRQVRVGIYQGGLSEWVVSIEDLMAFAAYAKERAQKVVDATIMRDKFLENHDEAGVKFWEGELLLADPTEDICRFCKAQSVCPAMARKVQETVGVSFEAVSEAVVETVAAHTDAELAAKMAAAGMIEDWIKAVRAEVERRLLSGLKVDGWGLELGREGPRKWSDAEQAEEFLRKNFRLTVEQSYDMQVISPTSAEKLLKTKHKNGKAMLLSKKQWDQLQAIIVRSKAVPSVKPAHVIKAPYEIGDQTPADTFDSVDEESLS